MGARQLDDVVLERLRRELRALYGPRLARVVLYGSRARGEHRDDSDYDVAVFLREYAGRRIEADRLAEISWRLMTETGAVVWMQPFPIERLGEETLFMRDLREEGVPL
jgi:predicted nucleotidyltransferase